MSKKITALILVLLLAVALMPPILHDAYATSENSASSDEKAASTPTPSPTFDPSPSLDPLPTFAPDPSAEPSPIPRPTINPKPGYELHGPDENGYWHGGYYDAEPLSQLEIKELIDAAPTQACDPVYETAPSAYAEPYILGRPSQESLNAALTRVNMIRRLAGMPIVTLNEDDIINAQYAAWINANNNSVLDHFPSCHIDIPEEFCQNGYAGASTSNLARGNFSISGQLDGYMSDFTPNNLADVGHRQHILDSRLKMTGFGQVGIYKAMSWASITPNDDEFDFIAWPCTDNMPSNTLMFKAYSPWSISFRKSSIKMPTENDNLNIIVEHNGEVITDLIYGSSPSMPVDQNSTYSHGEYIRIGDHSSAEICIIFRPDFGSTTAELEGEYIVTIYNLRKFSDNSYFDVTYKVNFFDTDNIQPEPTIIYGDIDDDGIVGSNDALLALRYTLNIIALTPDQIVRADVNRDGKVDANDALMIMRMALGMIP